MERRNYIDQKKIFNEKVSLMFNSITLLILNVLALVFATCSVYIIKKENLLLTQNIVIVSFYFCTNTLISLIMDILTPLILEKKNMLKISKVTSNEIEEKNKIDEELLEIALVLHKLDEMKSIEDDKKMAIKGELLNRVFGKPEILDTDEGINNNDQL